MTRHAPALTALFVLASTLAHGNEPGNRDVELTVGGVMSAAVQCEDDRCRGAVPLQPELALRFGGSHELYARFGAASGDGLNGASPFGHALWAADLESDVRDVNGSSRSNLLAAWYRYTADLGAAGTLETTFGVIDATDYLDDNAYANDEYTQFMSSALVNGPNAFVPSYDPGFALSWTGARWSARAVYMRVTENDDGNAFGYLGVQLGYRVDTPLGEGNYRVLVGATDDRFHDPSGTSLERRSALMVSWDQALGRTVGVFVRAGRQSDDAAIDCGRLYSGGVDLRGAAWGRERDNVGIGYARMGGGNGELRRSGVAEVYYRFAVNDVFAVTGDVQYVVDRLVGGERAEGGVVGVRVAAVF